VPDAAKIKKAKFSSRLAMPARELTSDALPKAGAIAASPRLF
jgi:hypothetical protein